MNINKIKDRQNLSQQPKLEEGINNLNTYISVLQQREIPQDLILKLNIEIDAFNAITDHPKKLKRALSKRQYKMVNLVEKQLKIVPINHYQNTWLALGIGVFGVPLGVVFGSVLNNISFLAIGMPIGMVLGIAIGTQMDKKAKEEGRQIAVQLK